ncbi:MAG: hypothetical protein HY092_01705 [Candidatus Kerfeldbacteria bacterium]|nr:hypothetical protein [Candidatus Kerfeldbacteria bacterium]
MPTYPLLPADTWTAQVNPPSLSIHPKKVQTFIRRLLTPVQVQAWLHSLEYNPKDTMHTLPTILRRGRAHCLEAALSAATILEYHGYSPLILDLKSTDRLDHTLFVYQHRGCFGTVGISRDIGLAGRKPVYKNLHALAMSYAAPYIDAEACLTKYGVFDLRRTGVNWRASAKNVWAIEKAIDRVLHRPLRLSRNYIHRWRKKFIAFRREHPTGQPTYFPHQQNWI